MKDYLPETASQTAGPYVHIGLAPDAAGFHIFEKNVSATLTNSHTEGERITLEGRVIDGSGTPVRDVLLEIWQANAHGRYNHPADHQEDKKLDPDFRGWGRACSDFDSGVWRFETIKPGCVVGRDGRVMAPHVNLWIVARGINIGLHTRMYFADEPEANQRDPVLNLIEWEVRRQTLIARRVQRGDETVYTFDIHLQGEKETVFFDV
ncbi:MULTISPECIES: protocatechuate 3,4-dioxygenase subunit alpha [Citrobacter]|uniref:protocatechuate 3,4-dioxygenase subunit alpha n=1 Tax=Citrobacter TaxID=544 RepID=UPI000741AFBB|nr:MULTISPECIES: protocatechuate 3,4-dioxygenase subunit alpha [Citrobacter]EHG7580105.1 protocatechuate 3,4-dioxygenase subunit alpha [Citrobacter sedlakii]EHG7611656.1 protocatechuate 3,4-dioxygenase subunit alpha [Citrobacter sedlakii]EIQ7156342.1 protocatechuate 3,4-dioxygenase subunit alpha [Citrobacter sedlakii]EKJ8219106.1 protocatechuate 3,4-dioxygenase subunit alpha [Citrobacter sedlakii]EKX8504614.1 protocatechuate 3,4-dioxygenase subunit alpha [Citrobacter sedlakii]